MAAQNQSNRPFEEDPQGNSLEGVPYEHEPLQVEDDAPRRAASARFIVDTEVGSEAAMRDAMDPANQSLADALRMSFRVLQVVMLVLVVLFLASGIRTIDEGKGGVRTSWGKIDSADGESALSTGLQFNLPYPVGDFIIFRADNREVDLGETFLPQSRLRTREQMLEAADTNSPITAGFRHGALVTRDGDLAHLELSARFVVDKAKDFVERINDADARRGADRMVELALRRAAIQVVAGLSLQEITVPNDVMQQSIRTTAQEVLDELNCGIELMQVSARGMAPFTVQRVEGDVSSARVAAQELREKAEQAAAKSLQSMAGEKSDELVSLIEQYEEAMDRDDPQQNELLAQINAIFDGEDATGEVADIMQLAKGYQWQVENTLGLQYRRFEGLLPAFRDDPQVFIKQQWLSAYARVLDRPDTEIIYVDPNTPVRISLAGSAEVQEMRQKDSMTKKQQDAFQQNRRNQPLWGDDRPEAGKAGRQFDLDREGNLDPKGADR